MIWTIVNSCIVQVAVSEVVPNRLRGLVLGAYAIVSGVLAVGLAPLVVALVREHLMKDASVGWAIVAVWVVTLTIAAAAAIAGRGAYARSRQAIITALAPPEPQPSPSLEPASPVAATAAGP